MEEENFAYEPINEAICIEMTPDKMVGVISFSAPENGGHTLSYLEVIQAIESRGICKGIDEEKIAELIQSKKYNYKYIIAQGERPVNGEDAQITLAFDMEKLYKLTPRENDDGTVEFRDLDSVRNVEKDEVLATKIPATDGVNGFNIMGQVLRAKKGRDYRLPKGKNTIISDDGLTLRAETEGKLEYLNGIVSVAKVYVVSGDVDSSIGNIDFVGDVIINGMVHNGFKVKAKGSIEIKGPVEGATIIAGGNIILGCGVQGTESSRLEAGGNIIAKFIQNASIQSEKDIITEGIWNSTVNAGGMLKVNIGKGCIMGGNISATNVISARNIGSPMGIETDIKIGIEPEVYKEYQELEESILESKNQLNNIEKEIIYLKTRNIGQGDTQFKQRKLAKLMIERQQYMEQLEEECNRYQLLKERLEGIKDGVIEVKDRIYPGTKIIMGNISKSIETIHKKCVFTKTGEQIHVDRLIDLEMDKETENITASIRMRQQVEENYSDDEKPIKYIINNRQYKK